MPATLRSVVTMLLLLAAVSSLADISCGDEPKTEPLKTTRDDCLKLINELANPKKRPFNGSVRRLPQGTSLSSLAKEQQPIADAYNQLSDNIEIALPLLGASLRDPRFSCVFENGYTGGYYCQTVGNLCGSIVDAHLNVYHPLVTKHDGSGHAFSLSYEPKAGTSIDTELWQRSLSDLQLERIEWARIQPQPDFFTEVEWKKAVEKLDEMAKQIRETKKPVPVKHTVQFFSK